MAIGDQRDLVLARTQLERWFATKLPGASDIEVRNLAAPGMGFSNETLLLDLVWRQGDRRHEEPLVVRVRPKAQVFPDYDLALQCRVMRRLEPTGVPVPHVRWFEESEATLGASFYVMDRIAGIVPEDHPPYHVAGVCTEMSPASRAALWWDGIEKMTRIHKVDWRALGFGDLDQPRWGATPLGQQLGYYEHFLRWAYEGLPHPTCTPGLEWLRAHQPSNEPVGLSWGDARIGNMIFRDDRCVAVLDWEMVALGNPEQDLAWWLFLDGWHHSAAIGAPRLEGFPSREATVARYEELMGRRVEHLHYYEVFAALRFAVIMIRIVTLVRAAGLPIPDDYAVNNTATTGLARLLGLPAPG